MFEEILFPLLLTSCLGRVYGKTRFQKLVFLMQKLAEEQGLKGLDLKYTIYLHGPFSFELNNIIETLTQNDFLEEDVEVTRDGYEVHIYNLTKKGESMVQEAQEKKLIDNSQLSVIESVANQFGNMKLDDLIAEAYRQFGAPMQSE